MTAKTHVFSPVRMALVIASTTLGLCAGAALGAERKPAPLQAAPATPLPAQSATGSDAGVSPYARFNRQRHRTADSNEPTSDASGARTARRTMNANAPKR